MMLGELIIKIKGVCDMMGNPLRYLLTAGQRHDAKSVLELPSELQAKALSAD